MFMRSYRGRIEWLTVDGRAHEQQRLSEVSAAHYSSTRRGCCRQDENGPEGQARGSDGPQGLSNSNRLRTAGRPRVLFQMHSSHDYAHPEVRLLGIRLQLRLQEFQEMSRVPGRSVVPRRGNTHYCLPRGESRGQAAGLAREGSKP